MAHPAGSSEPPQASTSNGKSSVRAKTPRYSRGFLISLQSLRLLGCGGLARPNTSTRRGLTCLRTWRGGVNDPAGFPPGVRFDSAVAVGWVCSVGGPMAKTPARGRGSKPQSSGEGVITLAKATLLPQSTAVPRRGPFCLTGYVRQSEHRLCEPRSPRLDHQRNHLVRGPGVLRTDPGLSIRPSAPGTGPPGSGGAERSPLSFPPTSNGETTAPAGCSSTGAKPIRRARARRCSSPAGP